MSIEFLKFVVLKEVIFLMVVIVFQIEVILYCFFFWNDLWVMVVVFVLVFIVLVIVMVVVDFVINKEWSYFFFCFDVLSDLWVQIFLVYVVLFQGVFGFWQVFIVMMVQLVFFICGGFVIGLGFKVGLFNIGGQGQVIVGVILVVWVGFNFYLLLLLVYLFFVVIVGFIGGVIWGGIVGIFKVCVGVNEVIVMIMFNYIVGGLLVWLLMIKVFQMFGCIDLIVFIVDWNVMFLWMVGFQLYFGFFLVLLFVVGIWWLFD